MVIFHKTNLFVDGQQITNLIFFLPGLKELQKGVSLFYEARLHAADLSEGQNGFESSLHLAGRPESTTGCGESVVYQPVLILNHLFKDGRLPFDPAQNTHKVLCMCILLSIWAKNVYNNLRVREQFWLVVRKKFIGFAKHTAKKDDQF